MDASSDTVRHAVSKEAHGQSSRTALYGENDAAAGGKVW